MPRHDLAVEDAQNFHLHPKIERYEEGRVLFAVFRTARYVEGHEEVDVGEVSVFLSRRFVITVRQGEASSLHGARMRLEERPELLKERTTAVLSAILDTIVETMKQHLPAVPPQRPPRLVGLLETRVTQRHPSRRRRGG